VIQENGVYCDEIITFSPTRRVAEGELVEVDLADPKVIDDIHVEANENIDFDVVYLDDYLIIINKPVGLVVHPAPGHAQDTLVNGLVARFPDIREVGQKERPGIIHRLDRDTSGLLVVGRTQESYDHLVEQLAERTMGRIYLTITSGIADAPTGTIDAPIGRSRRARTRMSVSAEGRDARTHYETLETWHEPVVASLVRCTLDTGRTHQIRVHLKAIGLPVLGDSIYGRKDPFEINRPLLHATELSFNHPISGEWLSFEERPPEDFQLALKLFRNAKSDS
jgi:23S rRNA pseudouridine1911/1915/1917 synthase